MKSIKALCLLITLLTLAKAIIAEPSQKDLEITVYLSEPVFVGVEYDKLFRVENLNYSREMPADINASVYYNITNSDRTIIKQDYFFLYELNQYKTAGTGNIIFAQSGNYTICGLIINSTVNDTNKENDFVCNEFYVEDTRNWLCNVSINISTDKMFYNNSEQIKIYNSLNNDSFYYIIEYWIEDLFGTIIKERYNTTNQNQKTYTPKIVELDRIFVVKNRIVELGCNNIAEKTADERLVFVLGSVAEQDESKNSSISIISTKFKSGDTAKFGEIINVELEIYKGDTGKKVVYAWIENERGTDISQKTKTTISKKYSSQHITLPIQLKPNCNRRYDDGDYFLVVDGLGIEKKQEVRIEDITASLCGTASSGSNDKSESSKEAELVSYPEIVENNKEFSITVKLTNIKAEKKTYEAYAYVYRGSKSYTGERASNLMTVELEPGESKSISFKLKVNDAEPGTYKLMLKYKRAELKTWNSLSKEIEVKGSEDVLNAKLGTISKKWIKSFYTRSKNPKETINLYSSIEEPEGKNLVFESGKESQVFNLSENNKTVKIAAKTVSGKNIFLLKLFDGKNEIDEKSLVVDFPEEKESIEKKAELSRKAENSRSVNSGMTGITGNAAYDNYQSTILYESPGQKSKKLAPYVIMVFLALVSVFFVFKKS